MRRNLLPPPVAAFTKVASAPAGPAHTWLTAAGPPDDVWTPQLAAGPGAKGPPKIKHIVVQMMEKHWGS